MTERFGRHGKRSSLTHRAGAYPRRRVTMAPMWMAMASATILSARAEARQTTPTDTDCIACHRDLEEQSLAQPAIDFEMDVHAEHGFGCLDCHGPDPTGSGMPTEPSTGFLSKPTRLGVIDMCGRCHSNAEMMRRYNPSRRVDQIAEYGTSVHGIRLATLNDPNVAVCSSCHPAHQIRPSSDTQSSVHPLRVAETCSTCHADSALMSGYDIPTDQRAQYEQSVHWTWMVDEEDLSAPTCNDCHGNHGAAPPGVPSVRNVCGQCHSVIATMFSAALHDDYFDEADLPGCAACHGNHDIVTAFDDMLLDVNERVCGRCHETGESGSATFLNMRSMIDSLLVAIDSSRATLEEAENLGMEISQAQFDLEEVTTSLVKARAAVHTLTEDSVRQEIVTGLAIAARAGARGHEALDEHLFRRQGLAVAVGLIVFIIIGLAFKIRQLERAPSFRARLDVPGTSKDA